MACRRPSGRRRREPKNALSFFVPPEGQKFIMVHIYVGIRGSRRPALSLGHTGLAAGGEATARRRLRYPRSVAPRSVLPSTRTP